MAFALKLGQRWAGHNDASAAPCSTRELPVRALVPARQQDTLEKVDQAGLVPLTHASIRIIEATRGVSPTDWRTPR
jgi:hypothetical protein